MAVSSKVQKLQMKKALAMSNGDLHRQREACHALIQLHMEAGRAEDERSEWADMAKIAAAMMDSNLEMRAHRQMVELGIKMEEYEESVQSSDRYVQLAKESEDKTELQRALVTKGRLCYHRSALDEAERLYQMALRAVDKTTVSQREKAEMRLGCWYNLYHLGKQRGIGQEAMMELLKKVSRAARAEQLHAWSFRSSLEAADVAFKVGNDEEASEKWKEAAAFTKHLSKEEAEVDLVNLYLLKAKMLLRKRNFREAKTYLDSVVNKHKQMDKDPHVCNFRRGVRKLVRAATRLERCKEGGPGRQKLLERLGDLTSQLELKVIAAKYYSDSLSCAEGQVLCDKEKAVLHYSVAACLYEAGRFQEAVKSFKAEIAIWIRLGQVESASQSWAKLARAMSRLGQPFEAVEKELNEALSFVRKKKMASEEVRLLRFLAKLQTKHSLHAEAEESLKTADSVCESGKVDEDQLEDFEEDGAGECEEFSSDSETEMADEEEEEEDNDVGHRSKRKRGLKMRRNHLGETELHTKCKEDGNKEAILRLIKAGAPVDVTDKFDFTPLLEACNHGFLEYVRILHDAGANLNWVGGKEDRVSALIDACVGGHLDIAAYLMDHGANVFHQDKDGWMAKDHLEHFLRENEAEMREEDVKSAKSLLSRMKKSLDVRAKSGQSVYVLQKKARSSALVVDGDNPDRGKIRCVFAIFNASIAFYKFKSCSCCSCCSCSCSCCSCCDVL